MNKTELKNFAIQSRRKLIEQVQTKALLYGIDEKRGLEIQEEFGQLVINDKPYPLYMKSAFISLKNQLHQKGYKQLIEEVAYTWFNRIIAIRYMEVHDYLPEKVKVLSSSVGRVDPDILFEYETMDLPVKQEEIHQLLHAGETEGAYRKLFIAQCNALNSVLPFLFEQIQEYTELLLPDFLLDVESVIKVLIQNEELTKSFDEIEVIGWLYQFYNSEPKDLVFTNLKKNKKIDKYDIPAATQLFTPKWIVKYMVENSLGHIWLEANSNSSLREKMRYYIEPVEQENDIQQQIEGLRYKNINIEEITIIDPCVGSGHMLVYAFDLLYEMYEEAGYPGREIPKLILEKNIYGLDIDDRAVQLASFALMMKARHIDRKAFNTCSIHNIKAFKDDVTILNNEFFKIITSDEDEERMFIKLVESYRNAKNLGTAILPNQIDSQNLLNRLNSIENVQLSLDSFIDFEQIDNLKEILKINEIMNLKYDVVITNPPYLGLNGMNRDLDSYLKKYYPFSKYDLSTVMMEKNIQLTKDNGYIAMINIPSWMYLTRFEDLRVSLLNEITIINLVHLGRGLFGSDFGTVSFVFKKNKVKNYKGIYKRLIDKQGEVDSLEVKESKFFDEKRNYISSVDKFYDIPTIPIAYWASNSLIEVYKTEPKLNDLVEPRQGMATSDNDRFLRLWFEINHQKMGTSFANRQDALNSKLKWFPYNKGGAYRKWYGNLEYVVNWENDGQEIKAYRDYKNSTLSSSMGVAGLPYIFKENITWSKVTVGDFSVRYLPKGTLFDVSGCSIFGEQETLYKLIGLLNSSIIGELMSKISPTLNFEVGTIKNIPIANLDALPRELIIENINVAKLDWDSNETSWDFKTHPFIKNKAKGLDNLKDIFLSWMKETQNWNDTLNSNECYLDKVIANAYHVDYPDKKNIDYLRKADKFYDTKTFLSYFIGCVVGRYSLDVEFLAFAGGEWNESNYTSFIPNKNGIIHIAENLYFENDIITRLREFLSVAFCPNTVDENMQWLADALEMKKGEDAEARLRRYFLDEFFTDHCKMYQKRPIFWLIDSGKQKGLRTLIYMHRYTPDTMATIRFEYLQEIQAKYQNEITELENRLVNPNLSASEKKKLTAEKTSFEKKMDELREFDKRLAEIANEEIEIDLDDGVKVNYEKFYRGGKGVLAKIK